MFHFVSALSLFPTQLKLSLRNIGWVTQAVCFCVEKRTNNVGHTGAPAILKFKRSICFNLVDEISNDSGLT